MAGFHRIGVFIALLVVATFAGAALTCTEWRMLGQDNVNAWFKSKQSACQARVEELNAKPAAQNADTGYVFSINTPEGGDGTCLLNFFNKASGTTVVNHTGLIYQTRNNPDCTCTFPLVEKNGECVDPCQDKKGKLANGEACTNGVCAATWTGSQAWPGGTAGKMCEDKCLVQGNVDATGSLDKETWYGTTYNSRYNGQSCPIPDVNGNGGGGYPEPFPDPLPPGKCPGEVNGKTILVDCTWNNGTVTQTTNTDTTTTTTNDGTTTTPTNTTSTNGDFGDDGKGTVTRTVTKTDPDGTVTTTTTKETGDKETLCKKYPDLPQCKTANTFGGSCTGGFQCTGDAALCAIARATNEQKCLLSKQSPESALYESSKANGTGTGITTETIGISGASFDSTDALGVSAACVTDLTVVVAGKSVTLPLSTVCPHLANLGTLLLGIAWLMAGIILFKSGA